MEPSERLKTHVLQGGEFVPVFHWHPPSFAAYVAEKASGV
jgi:hypothetical protein